MKSLFLDNIMENQNHYDYIICGGGASGLILAQMFGNDPYFENKQVLILEKEIKNQNDRTWCFWEAKNSVWNPITYKVWDYAEFKAAHFKKKIDLNPFQYKMIRGEDFYKKSYKNLEKKSNITFLVEEVLSVNDKGKKVHVLGKKKSYWAKKVFSSIPPSTHISKNEKYPLLHQHFIGWFVNTEHPIFDPETIQFMDFDLPQKGNTRFIYVLPFSKNKALIEYTLFSAELLEDKEYEEAILEYLNKKNAGKIFIEEREQGSIPMTAYPFWKNNTANIMHIGTAGGWTKSSTGYTFKKTIRKAKKTICFLKTGKPLNQMKQKNRFWFYDLLFLDVLNRHNEKGYLLFSIMFKKNNPELIFKFLDEKTTFLEELKIMLSFPVGLFVSALWKRMF